MCTTFRAYPTALAQFQSFVHMAAFAAGLRAWSKAVYLSGSMPNYRQDGSSRRSLQTKPSAHLSDRFYICRHVTYGKSNDLIGAVEYDMKQIMQNISDLSDVNIEVMETDKDHIHMMICSEPKLSPLQIVRRLKQM